MTKTATKFREGDTVTFVRHDANDEPCPTPHVGTVFTTMRCGGGQLLGVRLAEVPACRWEAKASVDADDAELV